MLQKQHDQLQQWMESYPAPSEDERSALQALQDKLLDNVWDWNEEELKVYFIVPLLELVRFDHELYKPFLSRELSMTVQGDTVGGIVDFMVASGRRSPKSPYFFIHEYKKERDSSNDPLGQLMIEMVTAQTLNHDNHPVYGAYIMGRYWHFYSAPRTLLCGAYRPQCEPMKNSFTFLACSEIRMTSSEHGFRTYTNATRDG